VSREVALLLGEPVTYSYDQRQRELARLLHGEADWPTHQIPKALAKTAAWMQDLLPRREEPCIKPWMIDIADAHYELDIHRAQAMLAWQPQHRLLDILPRMTTALAAEPVGWYNRHKLELPATLKAQAATREKGTGTTVRL
jgi:hypothetical protein